MKGRELNKTKSRPCLKQLNVFDRSVNNASKPLVLSVAFLQISTSLRNCANYFDKILSRNYERFLPSNLSSNFERTRRISTGL